MYARTHSLTHARTRTVSHTRTHTRTHYYHHRYLTIVRLFLSSEIARKRSTMRVVVVVEEEVEAEVYSSNGSRVNLRGRTKGLQS